MNRIFTFFAASLLALSALAQTTVDVVTGSGYANEAYYSFTNGTVATSDRMSWDIAFATNRYSISILANNGAEVELYTYPNGDINNWDNVDISNISDWPQMYNSIMNWSDGAFTQNTDESSQFDYGWGMYNMGNHHITGDSIFVIKTTAGNYKKLAIIEKNPTQGVNAWNFKYADIDGQNEQIVTLEADPYADKNFISYSLETNQIVENEPASSSWDLVFTKYYDPTIPYYVTGILSNSTRVSTQEVDGVTSATYEFYEEEQFSSDISIIGSDWKSFSLFTMSYSVDEDRVFFAKVMSETLADSSYWKLQFTGFTGTSEGKYTFDQKLLSTSSSVNEIGEIAMFDVYPNPAKDKITVIYDLKDELQVEIIDISGKVVHKELIEGFGFEQKSININHLKPGIYSMVAKSDNAISQRKFIIQ